MKTFGKGDLLLLGSVLIIIVIVYLTVNVFLRQEAGFIEVSVDGELIGTYSLSEDTVIPLVFLENENILVIKDKKARMEKANCPDKTCIHQGPINKSGQTIVCLPHRVLVKAITGTKDSELDTVAR